MRRAISITIGIAGLILIIIGVLLFINIIPLTTLVYTNVINYVPSGTETTPTPMRVGESLSIGLMLDASVSNVKCNIEGIGYSYSKTLALTFVIGPIDYEGKTVWSYSQTFGETPWKAPDAPVGTKFKFTFTIADTTVATGYAIIGDVAGYFTINDKTVDETSILVVDDPTLDIAFHATAYGSGIDHVDISIKKSDANDWKWMTMTEQVADTTWKTTYTLPSTGEYEVRGWLIISGVQYRKLSIMASWGEEPMEWFGLNQMIGIVLIAVGVALVIVSRRENH